MFDALKTYVWLLEAAAAAAIAAGCFYAGYHVRSLSAERDAAKVSATLSSATATAQARAREIETQMGAAQEKADHDYQALVDSTTAQVSTLADTARQLQRRLSVAKHPRGTAAHSSAAGSTDDSGTDWIGGFATCAADYEQLATDDAKRADKVNGLQGYIRGVFGAVK